MTIVTGALIAASTLGILFAADKQLRTGVFHLKQIQNKLSSTREDLDKVVAQKNQVESELTKARSEQVDAQQLPDGINKSLKAAIAKQSATAAQLNRTKHQLQIVSQQKVALGREIKQLQVERQDLLQQRDRVKAQLTQLKEQVTQLDSQINQLNAQVTQLKTQITQRDAEIIKRDQTINDRNRAIAERKEVEKRLKKGIAERETRLTQLATVLTERQAQLAQGQIQLQQQDKQLKDLKTQLTQGEAQLQQQDKQLQALEKQLTEREVQLQQRDKQLQALEKQLTEREKRLAFVEQVVGTLEQDYQVLRQGNVALLRGQVLSSGVLRIVNPSAARQAIDQLLSQANKSAIEATRPGSSNGKDRVVEITPGQVEQLSKQIKDGRDYLVRIISAGNYIVGEKQVQVFADAVVNQVIFPAGEVVAATSTDPSKMKDQEIRQRIDLLLAASQFRAHRAGIQGDAIQIGDGQIATFIRFLEQLKQYNQPLDLKAIAAEDTYTAGPLKIKLVAIQNGKVILRT
ncbi:MAG: DUF3084 domain-containing protein [Chamaesiphon sp.]